MPRRLSLAFLVVLLLPSPALGASRSKRKPPKPPAESKPGGIKVSGLRTEFESAPLGLDTRTPRLSWVATAAVDGRAARGQKQTGYQVMAASSVELLASGKPDLWDSAKVVAADALLVPWHGKPLRPGQRVHWKVRIWDRADGVSPWSDPAWFEMGLLSASDWKAAWIEDSAAPGAEEAPAPIFRKEFAVAKKVVRARAYVSGLGHYELFLNGRRVGDRILDPLWTSYARRVLYATYDVTGLLASGANVAGLLVGNGWWNPLPAPLGALPNPRTVLAVGAPRAIMQLEITYADGSEARITTDASWRVGGSGLLRNDLRAGELFDARRQPLGWERPKFDDSRWRAARVAREPVGPLRAEEAPPIAVAARLRAVHVGDPRNGVVVFDFGQTLTGRAALRARGPAGTRITLHYLERLSPEGGVPDARPGAVPPRDVFVLAGTGDELYIPRFTYHRFRYVAVEGYPGNPGPDALEAHRLQSALAPVGTFSCSNALFNRIHEAALATEAASLIGVVAGAPEQEPAIEGASVAAGSEAARLNFDLSRFQAKAVRDLADAVRPSGGFPERAPFLGPDPRGLADGAGSVGAGLAHPELLAGQLSHYGDRALVEEQYGALLRWLALLQSKATDGLIDRDRGEPEALAPAPPAVTGTAAYHRTALLAAHLAHALGRRTEEQRYQELAARIATAFNKKFLDPATGGYADGSQSALALALAGELVPAESRPAALALLTGAVEKEQLHPSTGALATKALLDVLATSPQPEVAARIVNQRTQPSWGFMLDSGATLWPTWKRDDQGPLAHPALTSVGAWLYQHVGGIAAAPDAVGFDRVLLRPRPTKDVTWANARYQSVRGDIASEWSQDDGTFVWEVTVPIGATAQVYVPTAREADVSESGVLAARAPGVRFVRLEGGAAVYEVQAGHYRFTTRAAPRPK